VAKNEKLLENLREFGLEEHEAKIYLASLSLGPTTILKLSKYGEVKRTTVYEIVDTLERKGLMRKEVHGFKTLYSPEHPEKLKNTLESKNILLSHLLPELEGKYHLKGTESSIKYYEGLKSIKNIYDDLLKDLKPHDFYYAISNVTEWQGLDEEFFMKNHIEKRAKMVVNTKLIFTDSSLAQIRKKNERNFNEEIKIIPKNTDIHLDFVITPYKLVMFQLHEPLIALVIENKSMITAQKAIFELLWEKSS
jgi:sugar-specific transcriptional regulator TrmB